jgi:hypothetical protein
VTMTDQLAKDVVPFLWGAVSQSPSQASQASQGSDQSDGIPVVNFSRPLTIAL